MKNYKNIFFDLDHTLWDFNRSSVETMKEFCRLNNLLEKGIEDFDAFHENYQIHNLKLWALYREGRITKERLNVQRFHLALLDFGINDPELSERFAEYYVYQSPLTTYFYPYAEEVVRYLHLKYRIHLITNGFEEVQNVKVSNTFLKDYIEKIITSEEAGVKKPDKEIFEYAFLKTGADPEKSIMIGDDPDVDIAGAMAAGMDQVLFDPENKYNKEGATYYISSLLELKKIL